MWYISTYGVDICGDIFGLYARYYIIHHIEYTHYTLNLVRQWNNADACYFVYRNVNHIMTVGSCVFFLLGWRMLPHIWFSGSIQSEGTLCLALCKPSRIIISTFIRLNSLCCYPLFSFIVLQELPCGRTMLWVWMPWSAWRRQHVPGMPMLFTFSISFFTQRLRANTNWTNLCLFNSGDWRNEMKYWRVTSGTA